MSDKEPSIKQETKQQSSWQEATQPVSGDSLATSTTSSVSISSSVSSTVERIPARFAIGNSDFRTMLEEGYLIVDKSLLIKEIIDDQTPTKLCIRARRSGKTLNLRMIELFFDSSTKEESKSLFQPLKIWSVDEGRYQAYQGSRPVIYLTFKDVDGGTFSGALDDIKEVIGDLYKRLHKIYRFDRTKEIDQIIKGTCSIEQLKRSLRNLSEILRNHCGTEVVILIDECDTPLQAAYRDRLLRQVGTEKKAEQKEGSSHAEITNFMRDLLSNTFKDNPHVYRAVLMGILPILDERMLVDNNIAVYGVLDQRLSPYFGFSRDEVREKLVHVFGSDKFLIGQVEIWCGGYQVGDEALFNPWSVVNFIEDNRGRKFDFIFRPHWIDTSGNDFIKELMERAGPDVRKKVKELIENQAVIEVVNKNMALNEAAKATHLVWSFLLFTGYVTYIDHVDTFSLAEGCERVDDNIRLLATWALDEAVVIAEKLINQGFINYHVVRILRSGMHSRNMAESSLAVRQLEKPIVLNWLKERYKTDQLVAISNELAEEPSRRQKIMTALSKAVSESKAYDSRKVSGALEASMNTYILKIPNKELLGFFKELFPTLRVNKSEAKVVAPVSFFADSVPANASASSLRKIEESREHKLFNGTISEKIIVAQELVKVNHVDALIFDVLIKGLFSERVVDRKFVDREFAAKQFKEPVVLAWLKNNKKARDNLLNASNKMTVYIGNDYAAEKRRIEVLGVLGLVGSVSAIDFLIKEVESLDSHRNEKAIAALGECVGVNSQQDKRIIEFLNDIFYKEGLCIIYKIWVLEALMTIVSEKNPVPAAIKILMDTLEKNPEPSLRIRAALALMRSLLINDQIASALARAASEDAEPNVRREVQRALDYFKQQAAAKSGQQQTTAASSVSTNPSTHGLQQSALEGVQPLQPGRGM